MQVFQLTSDEKFTEEVQRIIGSILGAPKQNGESTVEQNLRQKESSVAIAEFLQKSDCVGLFKCLSEPLKSLESDECWFMSLAQSDSVVLLLHSEQRGP
jgi:hypothetical protein